MYIHGFIDGALVTFVLGMAALITAAVVFSRQDGWRYRLPVSCAGNFLLKLGTTVTSECWIMERGEKEKDSRSVAEGKEYNHRMGRGRQTSIAGGVGAGWSDG